MSKNDENVKKAVGRNLLINTNDQVRTGVYSNLVTVTVSSNGEVMFDFIFSHPNDTGKQGEALGQLVSRVILPLEVAKSMKLVMDSQLGKPKKE
ncbi:DUF3467 domain-containing protein [Candidatus Curtissbacteria bacterium]|nr:DUF3467 domain-containing protein [Candidatus Curtissbacteria bacterium]